MIRLCHRSIGSATRIEDLERAIERHAGQVEEVFLDDPAVMARWREPWVVDAMAACLHTGHAAEVEI